MTSDLLVFGMGLVLVAALWRIVFVLKDINDNLSEITVSTGLSSEVKKNGK